jgi:deazaflavin-dependent oxidoreductase (nitroreductase family)
VTTESGSGRNQAQSWNDQVITELRAGADPVAGRFPRSALLLLGTIGARSGQPRLSPVVHFPDGERLLVVASAAGRDVHPSWYFNLLANPSVTVELWEGEQLVRFPAVATPIEGEERDRLFAEVVAKAPGLGEYQTMTDRVIPVVALDRG